jgi:hypothetical protein
MLGAPMKSRPRFWSWQLLATVLSVALPACNAILGIDQANETGGASGSAGSPERGGQGGSTPTAAGTSGRDAASGGRSVSDSGGSPERADGGMAGSDLSGAAGSAGTGGAGGGPVHSGTEAGAGGTSVGGTAGGGRWSAGDGGVQPTQGGAAGVPGAAGRSAGGTGGDDSRPGGGGGAQPTQGGAAGLAGAAGASAGSAGVAPCPQDSCGWCGRSCLGQACTDGLCDVAEVDSCEGPGFRVVASQDEVVWGCETELRHARGDTSAEPQSLVGDLTSTNGIVLEGENYVAALNASLLRGRLDGSAPPQSFYDGDWTIRALVADEDNYFLSECAFVEGSPDMQVLRLGKADSDPEIVLDPAALSDYYCPSQLAVDSDQLWFVASAYDNTVYRVDRTNWTIVAFWSLDAPWAYALTVDDEYIYVSTDKYADEPDSIMRKRKDGTGGVETFSSSEYLPTTLLLHQGTLYWANAGNRPLDGDTGEIKRLDLVPGASPRVLAVGQAWPRALAVDGDWLYWTGGFPDSSGYVRRVAR